MFAFLLIPRFGHHRRAIADVDKLANYFDLTKGTIAHDAMDAAANGVLYNMAREMDPDGIPWARLDPTYETWKATIAPGSPIGVLYGIMRRMDNLDGERVIQPQDATQTYGVTATARLEADKFTLGGLITGTRQPQRPFYGFTAVGVSQINAVFDQHFQSFTVTT